VKVYVVQRGDTLYSIAFRYGLDYRKVAQVNSIADPYTIYPGQNIYLWQVMPSPAGAVPTPDPPGPVAATAPGPATPAASTSSPVVVTAVPGIAAAPVSQVAMPPTPVYRTPPVTSGVYHPESAPVQAPVIETPAINTGPAPVNAGPAAAVSPAAAPTTTSTQTQSQVPDQAMPGTTPEPTLARAPTPAPTPAAPPAPARAPTPGGKVTAWRWPSSGSITRGYSSSVHKGIDIGGNRGEPIYAVADGTVVYAGTGIVGFGELVIIKHNDIYISAYGHNDRLLVKENDVVGVGQVIAEKGSSGTDTVKLHFEIRKEGKPIDPLKLLPGR
jgi:lipoprotein NlpD